MPARVAEPRDGVLFQEWIDDRFWMLVACQLVNLTTWTQARPAFEWIRETCVEPLNLGLADPEDLHGTLQPLGLWRKRAIILPRFALAWLRGEPETAEEVRKMPGCGKYAADSWAIFVEGRLDVEPTDGKLNWYIERRQHDQGRVRDDGLLRPGDHRARAAQGADAALG